MSTFQDLAAPTRHFDSSAIVGRSIVDPPSSELHPMHNNAHNKNYASGPTNWRGGSGRSHGLDEVNVSDFILKSDHIYMLVAKNRAIWIGTANDLIEDSASRSQFRACSEFADTAYKISMPFDEGKKMHLIADLLSGQPDSTRHAA